MFYNFRLLSALPANAVTRSYTYRPLGENQIRLLTLLPGEDSDPLQIRLDHIHRERSRGKYHALSYTWGNDDPSTPVFVVADDRSSVQSMKARDNLASALRHIRDRSIPKTLWIDALCINQADNPEKSSQVQQMADIYGSAAGVLVWLGPARDDSDAAMDAMRDAGSRLRFNWDTCEFRYRDADTKDLLTTALKDTPLTKAVQELLGREWFRRVWIRQEVFLAKRATVLCGLSKVDWVAFKHGVVFSTAHLGLGPNLSLRELASPYKAEWHYLRTVLAGTECGNLRDKVYGMLSIIRNSSMRPLEVNYDLEIHEVYAAAAKRYIQDGLNTNILLECHLEETRLEGLPSWVPDWSTRPSALPLDVLSLATGRTLAFADFPEPGVLRLAGVVSSRVTAVATTSREWREYILNAGTFLRENEIEAFDLVSALICGQFQNLEIPPDPSKLTMIEVARTARVLQGLSESQPLFSADIPSFKKLGTELLAGRALFATDDSRVGLGHSKSLPGDAIFFPLGSRFPFQIRPDAKSHGERWLVVGPCYMSQMMSGEIFYGSMHEHMGYRLAAKCTGNGSSAQAFHRVTQFQPDIGISLSENADSRFEEERSMRAFGVANDRFLTPAILRSKGIPVVSLEFV